MGLTLKIKNNCAWITFDQADSKVNLLSMAVVKEFDRLLDELKTKQGIEALVITSAKNNCFIAGADIKEIERIVEVKDGEEKSRLGQAILNKLEDLPYLSVAVIDGVALGGGCELALACQYRLATFNEKVRIGLPETQLGFVPGFGGTYRLVRTVGLSEGLKMVCSGKPIDGSKALKSGLVDRLIPQEGIENHVEQFVADIKAKKVRTSRYPRLKKKGMNGFLDNSFLGQRIVLAMTKRSVEKMTKGVYPAPLAAVDVISQTFYAGRTKGMDSEAKAFGKLAVSPTSKNLVHVFYISEKFRKLSVEGSEAAKPKKIEKVGVLGAGVMGGGIAQLLSSKGIWTRVKDINYEALMAGFKAAAKIYEQAVKKRKYTRFQSQNLMGHITMGLDYAGFAKADLVIEAVVEKMEVKKKVFAELDKASSTETILATNTSALSVTEMAREVKEPSRVIGIHFFNPVHRMPLVEIITTPMTSTKTLATTLELVKRLGKTPIVVKDSCGFVVNRILLAYVAEAGRLYDEGVDLERIDRLMLKFGMPMGPFLLSDEVGLDVGYKVLKILQNGFGDRFKPVQVFEKLFEKGFMGKKSKAGFYLHGKKRSVNPDILLWATAKKDASLSDALIQERMVYMMINEAAGCLADGIVNDPAAIDVGMIFGTGFPPFRGGLLKYADSVGIDNVVKHLEDLHQKTASEWFKPNKYILQLRDQKKGFYHQDAGNG